MLYELISEFAKWLSKADETYVYDNGVYLSYDFILIDILFNGDEITINKVCYNDRTISQNELNMNVGLFIEIASKLLKNRKKELQKQRIIELGNEEPYK